MLPSPTLTLLSPVSLLRVPLICLDEQKVKRVSSAAPRWASTSWAACWCWLVQNTLQVSVFFCLCMKHTNLSSYSCIFFVHKCFYFSCMWLLWFLWGNSKANAFKVILIIMIIILTFACFLNRKFLIWIDNESERHPACSRVTWVSLMLGVPCLISASDGDLSLSVDIRPRLDSDSWRRESWEDGENKRSSCWTPTRPLVALISKRKLVRTTLLLSHSGKLGQVWTD